MMKIYLDVSCLSRPFDDQRQTRIRLETEAITLIYEQFDAAIWTHVSSEMARVEINAIPNDERRNRVRVLLPDAKAIIELDDTIFARAAALEAHGLKAADAVHVAAAETLNADVFLTCDDRLRRAAERCGGAIRVDVANPVLWLKEMEDANA